MELVTKIAFFFLVLIMYLERLYELKISKRNNQIILARGGRIHETPGLAKAMRVVNLSWFPVMLLEVFLLDRMISPMIGAPAAFVVAFTNLLRLMSMQALGYRWTIDIATLPLPPVRTGIYRFARHPNYIGVLLEIPALPLIHGAWLTSIVYGIANAVFMFKKIRVEEEKLEEAGAGR